MDVEIRDAICRPAYFQVKLSQSGQFSIENESLIDRHDPTGLLETKKENGCNGTEIMLDFIV